MGDESASPGNSRYANAACPSSQDGNVTLQAEAWERLPFFSLSPIVLHRPPRGDSPLADPDLPVDIETLYPPAQRPEGLLLEAFCEHERHHVQFGADWLVNLATHALSPHEQAVIYVARRTSGDFVALPLKREARTGQAHALGNFYTSAYSPIIRSQAPEPLLAALFRYLAHEEKVAGITLSPLLGSSPAAGQLASALSLAGWKAIHPYHCFSNWTHEPGGTNYDAYLASRPARLQNTISRRTRQFLRDGRGELDLVTGGEGLEASIADFVAVYNRSWKQEEPFPEFVPALLRLAAGRGWLRLGIARHEGTPIASQAWLVADGTAYIFKLAHDEAFRQLSPGTVLTARMMRHVIDTDRVQRIDFLSGDDDYKRDWMSARGECAGIAAYNPATLRGFAMIAARGVRSLFRR